MTARLRRRALAPLAVALALALALAWPARSGAEDAAPPPPAAATADGCPAEPADEDAAADLDLDHVRLAVARGGPLRILALGSANPAESAPGRGPGYAAAARDALAAALPTVTVQLTLGGGKGLSAEQMVPILTAAVAGGGYDLVIWQAGTVEAVQGLRPETMHDALSEGTDAALAHGADVVLVDPQFSRFLRANADLDPYELELEQIAGLPGVALFHRFDLMHAWAEAGTLDLEHATPDERAAQRAKLARCLGAALARLILSATDSDAGDHADTPR